MNIQAIFRVKISTLILPVLTTFLVCGSNINAQTKIREGDNDIDNRVLYTIDGNKIRQGSGDNDIDNKVFYTIDGGLSIKNIAILLALVL